MAEFDSIKDVISFAIRLEQASQEFYRHLCDTVHNPAVRNYLRTLINEEKLHEQRLQKVLTEIEGILNISIEPEDIQCYIQAVEVPMSLDYKEAVKVARDKEKAAQMLYSIIAGTTTDPDMKKLFQQLSAQEKIHYDFFEKEYLKICISEN